MSSPFSAQAWYDQVCTGYFILENTNTSAKLNNYSTESKLEYNKISKSIEDKLANLYEEQNILNWLISHIDFWNKESRTAGKTRKQVGCLKCRNRTLPLVPSTLPEPLFCLEPGPEPSGTDTSTYIASSLEPSDLQNSSELNFAA